MVKVRLSPIVLRVDERVLGWGSDSYLIMSVVESEDVFAERTLNALVQLHACFDWLVE